MKLSSKQKIFFIVASFVLFGLGWYFGDEVRLFGSEYFLIGLKNDRFLAIMLIAIVAGIWSAISILRKLDIKESINSFWSRHKMKLLVFALMLVAWGGTGTGYEDNHERIWNVKLFGAKGDSVTDDTRAIQIAINACDSIGGGGIVYFPNPSVYYNIAGALDGTTNSQIVIPKETGTKRTGITLRGETAPVDNPVGGGLPGSNLTKALGGTRIKSTLATGGATGCAIFGTASLNQLVPTFQNLSLEVKNNPSGTGPIIGGISWKNGDDIYIDRVVVYIDTILSASTLPSNNVSAIELPDGSHGANYVVSNTYVMGFFNGFYITEHAILNNCAVFCCYNGIKTKAGGHAAYVSRIISQWNRNDIYIGAGGLDFNISQLAVEYATTSVVGAKWYVNVYTLNDSLSAGKGIIFYHTDSTGQSGDYSHFVKNGGTLVNAYSLYDSTSFPILNRANNTFAVLVGSNPITLSTISNSWSGYYSTDATGKYGAFVNRLGTHEYSIYDSANQKARLWIIGADIKMGNDAATNQSIELPPGSRDLTAFGNINWGGSTQTGILGSNGRLGIGITSPSYPLQVVGTAGAGPIILFGDGTRTFDIQTQASGIPIIMGSFSASDVGWHTGNGTSNLIYLKHSNQFVGISNSSPTSTLSVTGSVSYSIVSITGTYTILATDHDVQLSGGSGFTATLPTGTGIAGREYWITNQGSGTMTLSTAGGQTFANVTGTPTTLSIPAFTSYRVIANTFGNWLAFKMVN